jgi:pyruvate dehydrogenase E1 component beta subunit
MHVPGLKIVMPSTPFDAKGLLVSALKDNNPVLYIDDRWLYKEKGEVPEDLYSVPIGKAIVRKKGKDITVVASSYMTIKAVRAACLLEKEDIDIEVIDLRTLKPFDAASIFRSIKKTGRLIVVDGGWRTCGVAAEICAFAAEKAFKYLKDPIARITLPDAPAPASSALEKVYYPSEKEIIKAAKKILRS